MFEFKREINGVSVDVKLSDKVCVFVDYSGTGKTYLFKNIQAYCTNANIPCRYIDYNMWDISTDKIKSICKGSKVIILDNADLYLEDSKVLNDLENTADVILVCIKRISKIDMTVSRGIYTVEYDGKNLSTIKRG